MQGSGAAAVTITEAAEWEIVADYTTVQDNAFGDTWETFVRGLSKWSGHINGNFDTAQTTIFDAFVQTTPRAMYLYWDRASAARYYYGTVWPKFTGNIPMNLAKFTVPFIGDGALSSN